MWINREYFSGSPVTESGEEFSRAFEDTDKTLDDHIDVSWPKLKSLVKEECSIIKFFMENNKLIQV